MDRLTAARAAHLDAGRPEAVARQRARGAGTARERVAALVDPGSFSEYGLLARPAGPGLDGPADGLVTGTGTVAGRTVVVLAYDYTVLGGSQGRISHHKLDRMLRLAGEQRWPVAMLLEGGGARAHELDLDWAWSTGFIALARLSGRVPIVAAVLGPTFAGHATLAGLSDVVVAVRGASMGMAGPPLVAASLGRAVTAEQIGGIALHESAGCVDVAVDDEADAIAAMQRYLAFAEPTLASRPAPGDQRDLHELVPESSRRAYDMRRVVTALADRDSVLELRAGFGRGVITALARIHGYRAGVAANQPAVRAGSIDADAADKLTRFVALCDAHGIPLVFLVDTPGFEIGEHAERAGLVRHSSRVAFAVARARVPILTVVLRKAYGLAYYVMGSPAVEPSLLVQWPSAEYGGMALEGAAGLTGADAEALRRMREDHAAATAAARFAVDDTIRPDETRDRLGETLGRLRAEAPTPVARGVDPW